MKKALTVRSWEAAQRIVREWEAGNTASAVTVREACQRWLADCEARNLKRGSLRKYRHLAKELEERFGDQTVGSVIPVYVPLPKEVLEALSACEEPSGRYFWPGGALKTWTTEWQARMKKVFVIAGIPDGHPHRLRDSFSVELLEKGVPLETVSLLLGHKSIKTTEKHYAPWVHSRQAALEKAVMKTWESASYGISGKR